MFQKISIRLKALALMLAFASTQPLASDLNNIDQETISNNHRHAQSQKKVDQLYEQQREALQSYRVTQDEIEQLNVYNRQLSAIVTDQGREIASIEAQIDQIEVTQRGIMPLMERMLLGLEQFIKLDLPFLPRERTERVSNLKKLLLSANTTVSEKFRRVLEAYQIELEYGRTIETYRDALESGEMVDFLRLGRVAFYYVTLNGSEAYIWNQQSNTWQPLDQQFLRSLQKGMLVARKQAAPSLIELSIPAPKRKEAS